MPETKVTGWHLAVASRARNGAAGAAHRRGAGALECFALRDGRAGFLVYVPPGSAQRGQALVASGRQDRRMRYLPRARPDGAPGPFPALPAARPATSSANSDFKTGARAGAWTLMMPVVEQLSVDDMILTRRLCGRAQPLSRQPLSRAATSPLPGLSRSRHGSANQLCPSTLAIARETRSGARRWRRSSRAAGFFAPAASLEARSHPVPRGAPSAWAALSVRPEPQRHARGVRHYMGRGGLPNRVGEGLGAAGLVLRRRGCDQRRRQTHGPGRFRSLDRRRQSIARGRCGNRGCHQRRRRRRPLSRHDNIRYLQHTAGISPRPLDHPEELGKEDILGAAR